MHSFFLQSQLTSCKQVVEKFKASPDNYLGTSQINKIVYEKAYSGSSPNVTEIWIANYDGFGQTRVNVTIPSGYSYPYNPRLSPDGKKIFFESDHSINTVSAILSCDIDGGNVATIIGPEDGNLFLLKAPIKIAEESFLYWAIRDL